MGFVFFVLFWPIFLIAGFLYMLNLALPIIYWGLLIWNIIVLIVQLLVRRFWKKTGTMDRAYIDALGGWKRIVLLILKYGLLVFIIWEVILVLVCAVLVIWMPALLPFPG